MAAEFTTEAMSAYFKNLDNASKKRYLEKLKYSKCAKNLPDPYVLSTGWSDSPRGWPDIIFGEIFLYLINTPGRYTKEELKAYKSLEAYRLGETCSHAAAVLFKVEIAVKVGLSAASATSEACKWNQAFRAEVEPSTIQEKLELFKGTRTAIPESWNPTGSDPLPSVDQLMHLKEICPDACLFSIIPKLDSEDTDTASEEECDDIAFPQLLGTLYEEPFSDLTGDDLVSFVSSLWSRYHATEMQIFNLEEQTRSQSISTLWYKHREGRITASKVHDVVHMLPSTDPSNLVACIMGYSSCDLSNVPPVKYGLENESLARDWYASEMRALHLDFSCQESGFNICKSKQFLGASPDGIVNCSCCGKGILENKSSFKNKLKSIHEATKDDNNFCLNKSLELKKNHRYYSQVQFQMFVLQVKYCDFVICTGVSKHIHRVFFNKELIFSINLASSSESFFFAHILPVIVTRRIFSREEETVSSDIQTYGVYVRKKLMAA